MASGPVTNGESWLLLMWHMSMDCVLKREQKVGRAGYLYCQQAAVLKLSKVPLLNGCNDFSLARFKHFKLLLLPACVALFSIS